MDAIINYNRAAGFLKKSPSLEPHSNFTNIHTLRKQVIKALSQLFCPQSAIQGWSGIAMGPATYLLLEDTSFVLHNDPGATAIYPQWAPPTNVKIVEVTFFCNKNYFWFYKNIARACFHMFNVNITTQFKVSNTPSLKGWNLTMTIIKILDQLQDSYSN